MSETPLSEREIAMIETIGIMKAALALKDEVLLALTVRCGGGATIDNKELDFVRQTYEMEQQFNTQDRTIAIKLAARLR